MCFIIKDLFICKKKKEKYPYTLDLTSVLITVSVTCPFLSMFQYDYDRLLFTHAILWWMSVIASAVYRGYGSETFSSSNVSVK